MTRYFANEDGTYLGAFDGDDVEVPDDAIEVGEPPLDGRQLYDGQGGWLPLVERKLVPKSIVQQRIIEKGPQYMQQALQMLQSNAVYFARWFAPDHPAVYSDDVDARGLVVALGLDPDEILAPVEESVPDA